MLSSGTLSTDDGTAVPDLTLLNGIEIRGRIKNRSPFPGGIATPDTSRINYGGIENEGHFVGAASMTSPTGTIVHTGGVPAMSMADAAQTDVYVLIELNEWWFKDRLGISFEFINNHSGTGNVRFEYSVKEIDIFTDTPAGAGEPINRQETVASGAAGISSTVAIANAGIGAGSMPYSLGVFANYYVLRITRLGADGADTLAGPVGLIAASWFHSAT